MNYKHIKYAVDEAVAYIEDRKNGKSQPLYTTKKKLNASIDGFNWGRIYTFAGLSGSGKSLTLEEIKRDLVTCNPHEKFKILSFEFEMLAIDQIARNLSGKLSISTEELYSANKNFLSNKTFEEVKKVSEPLKDYPIYYVDDVGTVDDIVSTTDKFISNELEEGEGVIVTIDHVLLTKGKFNQNEKQIIDHLMQTCVQLKKSYSSRGIKIMFLLLSQLNRELEKQERVLNPLFHYPNKNDIFAASSVYYCSDIVLILHKPSIIEGLQNFYGPPTKNFPDGLPVYSVKNRPLIYWHIIKARFGTNRILMMMDDFKHSRVLEFDPAL